MTSFVDDDGNELQMDDDFGITKQLFSIFDLRIKGDFSINFKVEATSETRKTLNYFGPSQINSSAYTPPRFNLIVDTAVLATGTITVMREIDSKLECFFLSGNSNWLTLLNFNCNDFTTTKYDTYWRGSDVRNSMSRTSGIIFPFIDWLFKGQRFDNAIYGQEIWSGWSNQRLLGNQFLDMYPCLYVHTLLQLLAQRAGINITGSLLDDKLFKALIITPESADFRDSFGTRMVNYNIGNISGMTLAYTAIKPENIAPSSMKAIDLFKWVIISFGVIPSWNENSKTLTLTMSEKIDRTQADDWSSFYVKHETDYSFVKQYRNVNYKQDEDINSVLSYNGLNQVKYGNLQFDSGKTDGLEETLYTAPFTALWDDVGASPLKWSTPYIPFFDVQDRDAYSFATVSLGGVSGTRAVFNATLPSGYPQGRVVRIEDSGVYNGYHIGEHANTTPATSFASESLFTSTSAGTLVTQDITAKKGPFVMVALPSKPIAEVVSGSPYIDFVNPTEVCGAYFGRFKSETASYHIATGLNYGNTNITGQPALPLSEGKMKTASSMLGSPKTRAYFYLPADKFKGFDGTRWIYLRTPKLEGYFFVNAIKNYKRPSKIVEAELIKV